MTTFKFSSLLHGLLFRGSFHGLWFRGLRTTGASFWITLVALATLGGGAAGCAHGGVLTQGEIGRSGVRVFEAPPEHVFSACLGILRADGYEIASADADKGVIVTKPMPFESEGGATARGYRVTVSAEGKGTKVVAAPVLYSGERDVSAKEVWDVDAERAQWAQLFADVDSVIAEPVRIVPDGDDREAVATGEGDRAKTKAATGPATGFTRATHTPNPPRVEPGPPTKP
jgi:hypothetical protein